MNIFIYDLSKSKNVKMYPDKHVSKMLVEYAQLLCSAFYFETPQFSLDDYTPPYKLTHKNHPCAIWVRESLENWLFLYDLALELHKEYQYRYGKDKIHKSAEVIAMLPVPDLYRRGLTKFPQAMPDKYKNKDVVKAYQDYFNNEKQHLAKWTGREVPVWYSK